MPPRVPTRVFTSLPLSNGAVASSSSLPPPPPPPLPRQTSPKRGKSFHTARSIDGDFTRQKPNVMQRRSFHSSSLRGASAKDPYTVLGVKKDATSGDIKKAYYAFAKKYHPDSNKEKGSKERFMEIQSAYDILSDDSKRQAYDKYGSASQQEGFDPDAFARGGAGGFGGFQDFGGAFGGGARGGSPGDLFESLFGGAFGGGAGGNPFSAGGRARPTRGDDLESSVTLNFLEACLGAKRKIKIQPVVDCKPCSGSGVKPGQKKSQCTTCRGSGQQTFQVQGMLMASTCRACGGEGSTIPRGAKCGGCEGLGRIKESKEVDVDIPAGIEDGMKVKLPGLGDMPIGSSGPAGDLFVRINVRSSVEFRRQGTNLDHDAKVPLHVAMLGGKVRIPTLEGDVEVRVREGTQNGEEAVLKGRGVKSVYGAGRDRGDLVVGWKVLVPRSLSPFQKKIMQAYADDLDGKDPRVYFGSPPVEPGLDIPVTPTATPASSQSHSTTATATGSSDTASSTQTGSNASSSSTSSNGTTNSSSSSFSSRPSPPPEIPFVETETRKPPTSTHTQNTSSQSTRPQPQERDEKKMAIPSIGLETIFRVLPTIFAALSWAIKAWLRVKGRR